VGEGGAVSRSKGRSDLFLRLLTFINKAVQDDSTDLELASEVEKLILLLLFVPGQVCDRDAALAQQGQDQALREQLGQRRQLRDLVFQIDDGAFDRKLPLVGGNGVCVEPCAHETLKVGRDLLRVHIHELLKKGGGNVLDKHFLIFFVFRFNLTVGEQVFHNLEGAVFSLFFLFALSTAHYEFLKDDLNLGHQLVLSDLNGSGTNLLLLSRLGLIGVRVSGATSIATATTLAATAGVRGAGHRR